MTTPAHDAYASPGEAFTLQIDAPSHGPLPMTGADLIPLAGMAIAMCIVGLLVRRISAPAG